MWLHQHFMLFISVPYSARWIYPIYLPILLLIDMVFSSRFLAMMNQATIGDMLGCLVGQEGQGLEFVDQSLRSGWKDKQMYILVLSSVPSGRNLQRSWLSHNVGCVWPWLQCRPWVPCVWQVWTQWRVFKPQLPPLQTDSQCQGHLHMSGLGSL